MVHYGGIRTGRAGIGIGRRFGGFTGRRSTACAIITSSTYRGVIHGAYLRPGVSALYRIWRDLLDPVGCAGNQQHAPGQDGDYRFDFHRQDSMLTGGSAQLSVLMASNQYWQDLIRIGYKLCLHVMLALCPICSRI